MAAAGAMGWRDARGASLAANMSARCTSRAMRWDAVRGASGPGTCMWWLRTICSQSWESTPNASSIAAERSQCSSITLRCTGLGGSV